MSKDKNVIDSDKKESASFNPDGAPRKDIDENILRNLGKINATEAECAAILGMSLNTFKARLDEDPNEDGVGKFREIFEQSKEMGRSSLRRIQFDLAKKGNASMAIFLGKQLLGQKDKIESDLTSSDGSMKPTVINLVAQDDSSND